MNEKRGTSTCRNAVKIGSARKNGFEVTNERQALLSAKVYTGAWGPREIMLCKVPWYGILWTEKGDE